MMLKQVHLLLSAENLWISLFQKYFQEGSKTNYSSKTNLLVVAGIVRIMMNNPLPVLSENIK
jgi:hypothetical protein